MRPFASNVNSLKCVTLASGESKIRFIDDEQNTAIVRDHLRLAGLGITIDYLHNLGYDEESTGEGIEEGGEGGIDESGDKKAADAERKGLARAVGALAIALRLAGWDWRETLQFIRAALIGSDYNLDKELKTVAKCFYENGSADCLDAVFGHKRAKLLSVCLKRS